MEPQTDLFANPPIPRAATADPPTSHAAARSMVKAHLDHHYLILGVLWRPMHSYDLAKLTGLTQVQVARRMCELVSAGNARDSGQTAPGPTGRSCVLWEKAL